jgi:threonine/homoserine/homoserine lactone efflux protein
MLFAVAATLLVIVPGPNVLYIVTRGIDQGRRAAVVSAFGVQSSMFVHVGMAAVGMSALLASSEILFNIVRYAGVAYLVWLGVKALRAPLSDLEVQADRKRPSHRQIFWQGVIVNLLNPKVTLFCLALLPQFVDPGRGNSAIQILVLGLVMIAIGTISDCTYALASGGIGEWLKSRQRIARQRQRFSGVVYLCLGAVAALTGSHSASR